MRFSLARYMYRFIRWCLVTTVGTSWNLAILPVRISMKTLGFAGAAVGFVAVKPAAKLMKDTFFKEPPPKRYMKVGKPAVPPVSAGIISRPVAFATSDAPAPMAYSIQNRAGHEELLRRKMMQRQLFLAKFQQDVVQFGV